MFQGRIDRKGFAKGFLILYVPVILFVLVGVYVTYVEHTSLRDSRYIGISAPALIVFGFYMIAFFYPVMIGMTIRRLHDVGQPGGWSFLQLASTLGLIMSVFLMVWPGENEANEYGEPKAPRKLKEIFFSKN